MEDRDLVAEAVELPNDVRADEAGPAEDEDMHVARISACYRPDIAARKPIGFAPPAEPLAPLFVRIPAGLAEQLDRAAAELRRPKQELVAAALGDEDWALGRAELLPAPESQPEVLTAEQLAALLQLDVDTVRRLVARGELPGRKVGGHWRFSRKAVLEWLAGAE
jgi:excisionase family DNA binding protein